MNVKEIRKEGAFHFVVEQASEDVPGEEIEIAVYAAVLDGESALVLLRSLYFDEQSKEHIDNFCKKIAYDEQYRNLCLSGEAHWCRVARLYKTNARIIKDEQKLSRETLDKSCREIFNFIRRDLVQLESRPEYQEEMVKLSRGEEEDLQEALSLLARVEDLNVVFACQGSAMLLIDEREIYLPSCHSQKATITMSNFPEHLKNYLRSGPLGQQHLALFEENQLSAAHAFLNKKFIQALTAGLQAFWRKNKSECTMITLPEPILDSKVSVEAALLARKSIRSYLRVDLKLAEVSQLLWAAQGITRKKGMRTAPSAGTLYPLEVYLVVGQVEQLPVGIYKYLSISHELEQISDKEIRQDLAAAGYGQSCIERGSITIVITAVYERSAVKYGVRAGRYVHMEVGHAAQNIYLQAAALDLGTVVVGAFDDSKVRKILHMDANESPLYIMPVGRIQH